MKRDGTFSIQVLGDRDIVIHPTDTTSYERLCEDEALNDLALVTKVEQTELLLATMGIKNNQSKEATPKSTRKAAKGNGGTSVRSTVSKKAKRSESTTPLVSSKTKESMTSSMQSQYEEGITYTEEIFRSDNTDFISLIAPKHSKWYMIAIRVTYHNLNGNWFLQMTEQNISYRGQTALL